MLPSRERDAALEPSSPPPRTLVSVIACRNYTRQRFTTHPHARIVILHEIYNDQVRFRLDTPKFFAEGFVFF